MTTYKIQNFIKQIVFRLFIALMLGFTSQAWAQSEPAFCLQHFNTYGPAYAAGVAYRTDRLTRELLSEPSLCDVLQFQEVWSASQIDQVMTALSPQYSISAPNQQARIGVMSLFRGTIKTTETYTFNVNNEGGLLDGIREIVGVKKAFHIVTAQLPKLSEPMYFLNTHLHPTSQAVRLAQILDIYNWRLQHQDKKLVMSGDFNAESTSLERDLLMSLLGVHDSMEEVLGHYPKDFCSYCEVNVLSWLSGNHLFDYVFFSNVSVTGGALKAQSGEINLKGDKYDPLSDHFGLRVYLQLNPSNNMVSDLGVRKVNSLKTLRAAQEVLVAAGTADLVPAMKELIEINSEISMERGSHWDYWHLYR